MKLTRVNHVGVIVEDLDRAVASFRDLLGLPLSKTETFEEALEIGFLPCGDTQIELLQPLDDDGPAARYLHDHGPGIQHLAFEVEDVEAALAEVRSRGAEVLDETPRPGADGTMIAFLHPRSFNGILVELCQYRDPHNDKED